MTPDESSEWLQSADRLSESRGRRREKIESLGIPVDVHGKRSLARNIIAAVPFDARCLILIRGWSAWPSAANRPLFEVVRRAWGETRDLKDAPGHQFEPNEREQADCILHLCLLQFWDATLEDGEGRVRVSASNDEVMDLECCADLTSDLQEAVRPFRG